MFVKERFKLNETTVEELRAMKPEFGFNGFGEFIFYRTYSRRICKICRELISYDNHCRNGCIPFDVVQENWSDTVIKIINGTMSIRKDWYVKNQILWDEDFWQHYSSHMAMSMFKMEWTPPGRGLWAMGTDFIYERGSMALQNCGYKVIGNDIGKDVAWVMDALMMGVGTGFNPELNDDLIIYESTEEYDYVIADSREGWCESVRILIDSYLVRNSSKPRFDYSKIRKKGLPIRGFGGLASGPEPLEDLHKNINKFFKMFKRFDWYTSVHLKADIVNCVGCCVVAGNIRRSAELMCGKYEDIGALKDYKKYPYRESHGWMSNNSCFLETDEDFDKLIDIAESIKVNGEPGFINLQNLPFARIGKKMKGLKKDKATGVNPLILAA